MDREIRECASQYDDEHCNCIGLQRQSDIGAGLRGSHKDHKSHECDGVWHRPDVGTGLIPDLRPETQNYTCSCEGWDSHHRYG